MHNQIVLFLWKQRNPTLTLTLTLTLPNTVPQAQKSDVSYPISLIKSEPAINSKFRNLCVFGQRMYQDLGHNSGVSFKSGEGCSPRLLCGICAKSIPSCLTL